MEELEALVARLTEVAPDKELPASRLAMLVFLADWMFAVRSKGERLTRARWMVTASGPASPHLTAVLTAENGPVEVFRKELKKGRGCEVCRRRSGVSPDLNALGKEKQAFVEEFAARVEGVSDAELQHTVTKLGPLLQASGFEDLEFPE